VSQEAAYGFRIRPRTDRVLVFLLLALVLATPAPSAVTTPVPISLSAIPDDVLHGCRVGELEKALRGRLARGKRFHLQRDAEGTRATLEILECSRAERQEGEFTAKGGPVTGPTKEGGLGRGADREVVMETKTVRLVAVRARLVSGERFVDVSSGPKDRSMNDAADTLRRAIDHALRDRGEWLLASRP